MDCNKEEGIKVCAQTNIPQVDNTALECGLTGFVNTKCIIRPESVSYLGLDENTSLDVIIDTLVLSLQDARARIINLESQI